LGHQLISVTPLTLRGSENEASVLLDQLYAKTEVLVEQLRRSIESIAKALVDHKTLTGKEVVRLLAECKSPGSDNSRRTAKRH
jgi:ATP-dependent Zn protease